MSTGGRENGHGQRRARITQGCSRTGAENSRKELVERSVRFQGKEVATGTDGNRRGWRCSLHPLLAAPPRERCVRVSACPCVRVSVGGEERGAGVSEAEVLTFCS